MKYTPVFFLFLCLGVSSCTEDNKDIVSTEARIQEILASEEFQQAYPLPFTREKTSEKDLKNARIYETLLASLKEKPTPGTNIYDTLRETITNDGSYDEHTKQAVLEIIETRAQNSEKMRSSMQKLYQKYPELREASFRSQLLKQAQSQSPITQ